MSGVTLLLKNLTRNKLRTLLTVAAIALPMLVFTVARSFVDVVDLVLRESDRNMRVAVHQKLTYTTYMPQRLRGEIESLAPPGAVTAICRTSWFGGHIENTQSTFPNMAVDRDTFPIVYSEFGLSPEAVERFRNERRGAVVGRPTADQMNWKIGDRVTLVGGLPPFLTLEFVIAGIIEKTNNPWLYFGLDYYNECYQQATGEAVGIHNFWLKCGSPSAREWALSEIDKHFANTDHETRTEMESTFLAAFTRSGGDWVGLVWTVGRLIVLVAVSVAFNTLSMAFRERTRELAVLRALGFSAGKIVRMVLYEGFVLGLLAALIGVLPLYVLTRLVELQLPSIPFAVSISGTTLTVASTVAIACGVLAAIVPAWRSSRLKVATALRKVV
ncbi:MAG: FtsX-like permease family protein [Phycisphaerales bacterium]|nr:FtsX-like permease family protein [Phycisphaerales bacterium]